MRKRETDTQGDAGESTYCELNGAKASISTGEACSPARRASCAPLQRRLASVSTVDICMSRPREKKPAATMRVCESSPCAHKGGCRVGFSGGISMCVCVCVCV